MDYMFAPILNINLGVVQCWMLIELSLRIQQNISVTKKFAYNADVTGSQVS